MSDPVAAAAAAMATETAAGAAAAEQTFVERIEEGLHNLEEKVEHLIHPGAQPQGEAGKDVAGVAESQNASDSILASPSEAVGSATAADTSNGTEEVPNAAAPPAASPSESVTQLSAPAALPAEGTPAVSDSGVRERALKSLAKLRAHFWTFSNGAMQDMHAELDFLEGLFK